MKFKNNLEIFFTILIFFFSANIYGQGVIWSFHLSEEEENLPQRFWVDEDGVSHLNIIKRSKTRDKYSTSYNESYLIKISRDGDFVGSLSVSNCKNRTSFLPFRKNRYLIYGYNCVEETANGDKHGSRLFNEKGVLMRAGESLPDYRELIHLGEERITIFSRKMDFFVYSPLNIGYLNKRLKARYDSVSIQELKLAGYGFTLGQDSPLKIGKSGWVIPFEYGVPQYEGSDAMRTTHGGFFVVDKNKISWKYIPEEKYYYPVKLALHNDQIVALVARQNRPKKYIKIFDKAGNIQGGFEAINGLNKVEDMKMQNGKIILLTPQFVYYYSFTGEMLKKVRLPEMEFVQNMETYDDHSVLIAGTRDKKTLLTRIGIKDQVEIAPIEQEKPIVKFSSIESLSEEESVVSVFPNPTTRTLNFTFQLSQKEKPVQSCIIEVFSVGGKKVMQKNLAVENAQIEVTGLASGTYFYRILINKSAFLAGQFVKI